MAGYSRQALKFINHRRWMPQQGAAERAAGATGDRLNYKQPGAALPAGAAGVALPAGAADGGGAVISRLPIEASMASSSWAAWDFGIDQVIMTM